MGVTKRKKSVSPLKDAKIKVEVPIADKTMSDFLKSHNFQEQKHNDITFIASASPSPEKN